MVSSFRSVVPLSTLPLLILSCVIIGCREPSFIGYFSVATCERADCRDLLRRPLDGVQFKAAHNSIDREESLTQQLEWSPCEPFQSGCRGIELDLVQSRLPSEPSALWEFTVKHGLLAWSGRDLRDCLGELRNWSDRQERHDLVVVHLDLKSYTLRGHDTEFPEKLDGMLDLCIGRDRIFTPGELMSDGPAHSTLLAGAMAGWPSLGTLEGRFLFIISGDDTNGPVHQRKRMYAETMPSRRLAFVDIDQRLPAERLESEIAKGERVVVNLHFGTTGWQSLANRVSKKGMLTRIWVANSEEDFAAALDNGIHVISTDKVRDHPWATVGALPFRPRTER